MEIGYRDGPCGSGKTRAEIIRIVMTPALYVFAVERRSAIVERVREIQAEAKTAGTRPVIRVVSSGDVGHLPFEPTSVQVAHIAKRWSVIAEISALPKKLKGEKHVIVLVTHEGLKQADLSAFAGWHVIVDETPGAFECRTARTPALLPFFQANYRLEPISDTQSEVRLRDTGLTLSDFRHDDLLGPWGDFHKRVVSRREVVVGLTDWSQMADRKAWNWWSVWSPLEMAAFASVTICAHAFSASLTAIVWRGVWGAEFSLTAVRTPSERVWKARDVLIRYAADAHTAGSYWWESAAGATCLKAWGTWIASEYPVGGRPHLLTSNGKTRPILEASGIGGVYPTVRVAGANCWSAVHDASIAYAAKPRPGEAMVLKSLGIDPGVVTRAREHEDIVQFAMRTSLRDPLSTAPVRINVYDRDQAEMLAVYLGEHYPAMRVETRLEEVGIEGVQKPRRGRPSVARSEAQQTVSAAERKARRAENQRRRRVAERRRRDGAEQNVP